MNDAKKKNTVIVDHTKRATVIVGERKPQNPPSKPGIDECIRQLISTG